MVLSVVCTVGGTISCMYSAHSAGGIIRHICEAVALLFGNDSSYEYRLDGLVVSGPM